MKKIILLLFFVVIALTFVIMNVISSENEYLRSTFSMLNHISLPSWRLYL